RFKRARARNRHGGLWNLYAQWFGCSFYARGGSRQWQLQSVGRNQQRELGTLLRLPIRIDRHVQLERQRPTERLIRGDRDRRQWQLRPDGRNLFGKRTRFLR